MASLTKVVITLDDGSVQEFDIAPVAVPEQVVDITPGESVEVVAEAPADAPAA